MIDLEAGFKERLAEVDTYLEFLQSIATQAQHGPPRIEGAVHPISVQQQRILYSSVYLQLYNLVESTITRCLEAVVEAAITSQRWQPSHLNEALWREWVRVMARTHENLTPEHRLDFAVQLSDHLKASRPLLAFTLDKGGGGNWDDEKIKTFSDRIGLKLVVSPSVHSAVKRPIRDNMGPLALVKNLRNCLAHGSISFEQCAENLTVESLIELRDKIVNYLQEAVNCFSAYVKNFEYLIQSQRPP